MLFISLATALSVLLLAITGGSTNFSVFAASSSSIGSTRSDSSSSSSLPVERATVQYDFGEHR